MTLVLVAIISIWLHELGHAAACRFTGDRLGSRRWSWKPFVNLDPILSIGVPVMFSLLSGGAFTAGVGRPFLLERYDWRVLIAGPTVNMVLVIVGALIGFEPLIRVNAALVLVNMLPLPPLDGWAIYKQLSLRAIARRRQREMIQESPRR